MTLYIKKIVANNGLKYYFGKSGTQIINPSSTELVTFVKTYGFLSKADAVKDIPKTIFLAALGFDESSIIDIIPIKVD